MFNTCSEITIIVTCSAKYSELLGDIGFTDWCPQVMVLQSDYPVEMIIQ